MGIWPGHRGNTPTLYEKCRVIFNDHRESGPRFNVSSERLMNLSTARKSFLNITNRNISNTCMCFLLLTY